MTGGGWQSQPPPHIASPRIHRHSHAALAQNPNRAHHKGHMRSVGSFSDHSEVYFYSVGLPSRYKRLQNGGIVTWLGHSGAVYIRGAAPRNRSRPFGFPKSALGNAYSSQTPACSIAVRPYLSPAGINTRRQLSFRENKYAQTRTARLEEHHERRDHAEPPPIRSVATA